MKEFEFYHGIVFAKMLHSHQNEIVIKSYPSSDNASYAINNKIGIYIKYCTKRLSPWSFSFNKRHKDELTVLAGIVGEVFLLLVCDDDGIVVLSAEDFNQIISSIDLDWIRVTRRKGEMYAISGSGGRLPFKVGKSDFPGKIFHNQEKNR